MPPPNNGPVKLISVFALEYPFQGGTTLLSVEDKGTVWKCRVWYDTPTKEWVISPWAEVPMKEI